MSVAATSLFDDTYGTCDGLSCESRRVSVSRYGARFHARVSPNVILIPSQSRDDDRTGSNIARVMSHLQNCFSVPSGWARLLTLDVYGYRDRKEREGDTDDGCANDPVSLATNLCTLGYDAHVVDTGREQGRNSGEFTGTGMLYTPAKHAFVVVQPPDGADLDDAEVVKEACTVDLRFREQFGVPKSCTTPRYDAILNGVVPRVYVGTRGRMLCGATTLAREIGMAFRENSVPLPPWRSPASMVARWSYHAKCASKDRSAAPPLLPVSSSSVGAADADDPFVSVRRCRIERERMRAIEEMASLVENSQRLHLWPDGRNDTD